MLFNIKTMNAIAQKGIDELKAESCAVSPDEAAPDALLIRSAKLHDAVFNKELLCIGRAGIGVDNIPIERCTAEGIAVFNTPGANADSVKELLLCALTMASRDIVGAVEWVESLAPEGDKIPALVEKGKNAFAGPEVSGKRLGVIGLGAIGSRVANAALKLDMEVSGYDPYLSVDSAWNLSSKVEHVTDLHALFRTCDYLTMHIHSTPETFHYLNAETFAKMKPGMRILNFARGELVDDDALLAAIESGRALCDRLPEREARRAEKRCLLPAPRRHDAGGGGKVRGYGRAGDCGLSPQRQHPQQRQSPERDAGPAGKEPPVPHPPQPARHAQPVSRDHRRGQRQR